MNPIPRRRHLVLIFVRPVGCDGWHPEQIWPGVSFGRQPMLCRPGLLGSHGVGNRPPDRHLRLAETIERPDEAGVYTFPCDDGSVPETQQTCLEYWGTSYRTNSMLIGQDQLRLNPSCMKPLYNVINQRLKGLRESMIDTRPASSWWATTAG